MSSRSATLSDVARLAGVSLATASRVLNGSTRVVGGELREKVLEAASILDYTPNLQAQAVARGASSVLGLVVHDIDDPYFSAIVAGVMQEAGAAGLIVSVGSTGRDFERELEYVAMLRAQRARGVILAGSRTVDREMTARLATDLKRYCRDGGRAAFIGQQRMGLDAVMPGNRAGGRALAGALAELGHRRYVVLAGPPHLVTARDRVTGFRRGLRDAGVPDDQVQVVHGAFTRDGGFEACRGVLADGLGGATAIFAVNDVMAVGAMAALRDAGVGVPDEVSVAGFDDIATLRDVVPRLSTVRLPLHAMGTAAAQLVLREDRDGTARVVRIKGEVVLRESTRDVSRGVHAPS